MLNDRKSNPPSMRRIAVFSWFRASPRSFSHRSTRSAGRPWPDPPARRRRCRRPRAGGRESGHTGGDQRVRVQPREHPPDRLLRRQQHGTIERVHPGAQSQQLATGTGCGSLPGGVQRLEPRNHECRQDHRQDVAQRVAPPPGSAGIGQAVEDREQVPSVRFGVLDLDRRRCRHGRDPRSSFGFDTLDLL